MNRNNLIAALVTALSIGVSTPTLSDHMAPPRLEELQVWGGKQGKSALSSSPTTEITAVEMASINLSTIEDAVAYEPNMIVRRRFIGDANGSLGIRGANMFQTARTMVYADGLPLHYHLQTRWSGAPRWSLIAPDEVESVEVVYGPFSALYPGNAMGGVVRIKTRTPTERTTKVQGALFNQSYDRLATDENYSGGRFSVSYGDKFDDLTVFAFYNRLQNQGQPQTQYFASPGAGGDATPVEGAVPGINSSGAPAIYYGDSGAERSTTDLLKLKLGYHFRDFHFYSTVAYEDRQNQADSPNNFLRDAEGNPVWGGTASYGDQQFAVNGSSFSVGQQDRRSLLVGAGVAGPLSDDWSFDLNMSHFQILEDHALGSSLNPADPAFTGTGRITDYDDTGWRTLDFQTENAHFIGRSDMTFTLGAHYSHYQLGIRNLAATYPDGAQTALNSRSGGETAVQALFAEHLWRLTRAWDMTLGARYEWWEAEGGYLNADTFPDRSAKGLSPKFSLGYRPAPTWQLRYSAARALRFPLVEELYQNESRISAVQTSNPGLAPEDGIHHNMMIERLVGGGFARLNLFQERVEDTIFNQLGIVNNVQISTFLAIDEVTTKGVEFILNQPQLFHSSWDMRFNVSYLEARVTRNQVNPQIEGNRFPRMPKWQSNLLLTYRFSEDVNLGAGLRYASNSYGELSNADSAHRTFGAHDEYVFLNVRGNWQVTHHLNLALGVDNLTDAVAYVHHPWPSRTLYLEAGYAF